MPARSPFGLSGVAASDLTMGMGSAMNPMAGPGDMLRGQIDQETDEERRKRLLGLSQMQQGGSLAASSLFGPPSGSMAGGLSRLGGLGGRR